MPELIIATVAEIADALNLSGFAVRKRRDKYQWETVTETGVDKFDISTIAGLDDEERRKIETCFWIRKNRAEHEQQLATLKAIAEKANTKNILAKIGASEHKPPRTYHRPAQIAGANAARKQKELEALAIEDRKRRKEELLACYCELPESAKRAAEARAAMLDACTVFLLEGGYKARGNDYCKITWSTKGLRDFCRAFVSGALELPEEIAEMFTRKGKRSLTPASLLNWRDLYREQGLYGIADHYHSKNGVTSLTDEQQEFVGGMLVNHPGGKLSMIMKGLKTRFKGKKLPSRHSVSRFVKYFIKTHYSAYLGIANPDKWKNELQFAYGDASESIIRLNQRWEGDSTKADVLCTDGRCCVIGTIDVFSRRLKLHVSPTSKSAAIAALFRRCLIDWGVPEEYRTDCGADYTSQHISRICESLEIYHHTCQPFTPEEKPFIERAFQTFSHGLVEALPGYIGHSVAERKEIEARNKSFAKRLMTPGEKVDVKMTMAELQTFCDQWTENIYHQAQHSGLDGMTPAAKARAWIEPVRRIPNERALDVLLSPAPSNNGRRKIGKKGICVTYHGIELKYAAGEFANHGGKWCQVLIDETDLGRACIFFENGDFLCIGEDPAFYGISRQDAATILKKRQKAAQADNKAALRRIGNQANTRDIAAEILRDRTAQAVKISELPKKSTEYTTSAIEEAATAARELERKNTIVTPVVVTDEMKRKVLEGERKRFKEQPATALDKFFALQAKVKKGEATQDEKEYVASYERRLAGHVVNQ